MRILLLANHLNAGGITSYVMTLSGGLVKAGHRVVVATSGGDIVGDIEAAGVRHVPMNLRLKSEINPLLFFNLPRLLALLKEEEIGIMHAQTRVTAMLAALASRLSGIPYVMTCHGYFNPHLGRRLVPLWGRRAIAISRAVVEHLTRDLGILPAVVDLVPNGVDLKVFHSITFAEREALRKKWQLKPGPVVGMVARLSDVKGHAYLIEAMVGVRQAFPDVRCLMLGEGPLEHELRSKVRSLGLEETILFLPVTGRTAEALGLFDVVVAPSVSEGLGLSAMEAMAAGLPVVASSVGGLLDLIEDGKTGRLVASQDPAAFAGAIKALLADPVSANRMGERARSFISANFSEEKMVAGTAEVYEKVLNSKTCGGCF